MSQGSLNATKPGTLTRLLHSSLILSGFFFTSLFCSLYSTAGFPVAQTEGGSVVSNCGLTLLNMPCSQIRKKKGKKKSKKTKIKQTKNALKNAVACIWRTGLA